MSVNDLPEYDVIDLPDTITEEGEEVEVPLEPLFRLNGEEYLIPATPSAGMALGYLELQTKMGPDAAIHWMMVEMLGEEAYDVLKTHPSLKRETLDQIIQRVEKKVLGGMQGKGKAPAGAPRRRAYKR